MRETVGSLRAYLVIAGLFSAYNNVRFLLDARASALNVILSAVALAVAAGFVVAGLRLAAALLEGPGWILKLLLANGALTAVTTGLLALRVGPAVLASGAVMLLVTWYLYRSVRRLSREAGEAAVERVAAPFD